MNTAVTSARSRRAFASPISRADNSTVVRWDHGACGREATQHRLALRTPVRQVSASRGHESSSMMQRAGVIALLSFVLFARIAGAHSMHCDGPAQPQSTPTPSLQQILDGLVVSGPGIDAGAPIDTELFLNSAAAMTAQLV